MLIFSRFPYCTKETTVIISLGSFLEGYLVIPQLDPINYNPPGFAVREEDFDNACFRLWNTIPEGRREIIRIMINLYHGNDVVFLVDERLEYSVNLAETMMKYIQDIYGYRSNVLRTPEDIDTLVEGDFSELGLIKFDMDLEWYRANFGWKDLPNDPPEGW